MQMKFHEQRNTESMKSFWAKQINFLLGWWEKKYPEEEKMINLASNALIPKRSPGQLSIICSQVNASQCITMFFAETNMENIITCMVHGNCFCQSTRWYNSLCVTNKDPDDVIETLHFFASACSGGKIIEEKKCWDFKRKNFVDNFQINQISILYHVNDRMPKDYAQVKKTQNILDFYLHMALLDVCALAKDANCAIFYEVLKAKNDKQMSFSITSFILSCKLNI